MFTRNCIFVFFILLAITAAPPPSYGDDKQPGTGKGSFKRGTSGDVYGAYTLNREYFRGWFQDTKRIAASPASWNKSSWIKASLTAGITAALYGLDQEIRDEVQEKRNTTSDDISGIFEVLGNGTVTIPSLALLYAYGHYYEKEKPRKAALLSFESFFITGIITQGLKFSTHRHRPNTGNPYDTWDGPGFETGNLSFPSGHASSAFSIATVIATVYRDNLVIPPIAYGSAALTSLSRVNDDKHWASDVFLGSVLGYYTAKAVIGLHDNKNTSSFSLYPSTYRGDPVLTASYRF